MGRSTATARKQCAPYRTPTKHDENSQDSVISDTPVEELKQTETIEQSKAGDKLSQVSVEDTKVDTSNADSDAKSNVQSQNDAEQNGEKLIEKVDQTTDTDEKEIDSSTGVETNGTESKKKSDVDSIVPETEAVSQTTDLKRPSQDDEALAKKQKVDE